MADSKRPRIPTIAARASALEKMMPEDLLVRILAFLPGRSFLSCKAVCARWDALRHRVAVQRRKLATLPLQPFASTDFSSASGRVSRLGEQGFTLHNGARILADDDGVRALRIPCDGPYATMPVDIGPAAMPHCTLEIEIRLDSIANDRGWVLGNEEMGFDRTILMHDGRFGGGVALAVGREWESNLGRPVPPVGRWMHVCAVFRQDGPSHVFLDGRRSNGVTARNRMAGSKTELWIGRAHPPGHYCDCWIKHVKVYDRALEDETIGKAAVNFHNEISAARSRALSEDQ